MGKGYRATKKEKDIKSIEIEKEKSKLGMEVHTYNPSTWEAGAETLQTQTQPEQLRAFLFKKEMSTCLCLFK